LRRGCCGDGRPCLPLTWARASATAAAVAATIPTTGRAKRRRLAASSSPPPPPPSPPPPSPRMPFPLSPFSPPGGAPFLVGGGGGGGGGGARVLIAWRQARSLMLCCLSLCAFVVNFGPFPVARDIGGEHGVSSACTLCLSRPCAPPPSLVCVRRPCRRVWETWGILVHAQWGVLASGVDSGGGGGRA